MLTIAHRLRTIIDSDRVMVLEAGTVVEFDTPSALLQDPLSVFAQLVAMEQRDSQQNCMLSTKNMTATTTS